MTKQRRTKKKAAAKPVSAEDVDMYLVSKGWVKVGLRQWKHPNLLTLWETSYAYRLQLDADAGKQEPVFRQLRGDDLVEEPEEVA